MKTKLILSIVVAACTATSVFAGDKACCATSAGGISKEACVATFAKLDLNAEQKSKMETLADDCAKGGCTKDSMAKMEKGAKGVLSKEQFAAWKTNCGGQMSEKTQS